VGGVRSFSIEERRDRLAARHGLTGRFASVAEATEAMVVLHATDPATVYLSALARCASPSIEAVSRALYDDRSIVRILAMRRTLFAVPAGLVTVVERSSTDEVAANQRKLLAELLAGSGIDDPTRWLAAAAAELEAALPAGGASARQITGLVPRLATKVVLGPGTKWETTTGATSRVLLLLAAEGLLVRGRPAGRWTGRQYQWHLRRHWLAGAGEASAAHTLAGASTELVRRWLAAFGPATFDDLRWWTGWKVRQLRPAVEALDVVEVDLGGTTGLALADDIDSEPAPGPWVALLPALDPTPMGWKERGWYLGPHQGPLFDRSGNIGPTVWVDGRIVGGWGQRPDGTIVSRLLEDVGSDHRDLIDRQAANLAQLMGDTVVKPSFPTPLQRELSS
jgi:hypothetical protein